MTFFRKNTWGPSSVLDYKKLNSMAQNDLAIKEIIDRAAKGVIMWNTVDKLSISKEKAETPSSPNLDKTWRMIPEYENLKFSVGEDRFLNFVFHPGLTWLFFPDAPTTIGAGQIAELRLAFALDGEVTTSIYINIYGPQGTGLSNPTIAFTTYSPSITESISEGTHSLSVAYKFLDTGNIGVVANMHQSFLYVEDLGRREV